MEEYTHLGGAGALSAYLGSMGEVAEVAGDYQAAENFYQQAIELLRQQHNVHNLAADLLNLGRVRLAQSDLEAASAHFSESLKLAQDCGRIDVVSRAHHAMALVHISLNQHESATVQARKALDLFRRLGMKREQAEAETLLAELRKDEG
jgi:tetratricopeptide (TPR) repeat protein